MEGAVIEGMFSSIFWVLTVGADWCCTSMVFVEVGLEETVSSEYLGGPEGGGEGVCVSFRD